MKKKIVLLLMILLTAVCVPVYANAKADNGFIADDEVSLKKEFNTSTFVAGNNVEMSSTVDGANFVAGNNVKLSSSQDYLFAAGNSVTLEGINAKDVFVAGNTVTVTESSIRDLYVAAATIRIDSNVGRNVYVGGDKVTINSIIDGNVNVAADRIIIGEEAVITGTLSYPEDAEIDLPESASVGKTKTYKGETGVDVEITPMSIVISYVTSFVGLLIVAFVLLAIHKPLFKSLREEKQEAGNMVKSMAIGFGVLVGVPIASILLLITVVGIPLSLIVLVLYFVALYLSSVPTAYFVGNWIMKDKKVNDFLLLGCSLLAIYILKLIPVIGGLVGFASLILGLGLFVNYIVRIASEAKK